MTIANRHFGVELEISNFNRWETENIIKSAELGIECCVEGYNHDLRDYWKIVPDESVAGCEVVSPKLLGEDGITEVVNVAKTLARGGVLVDSNCGFHVHVDASDLGVKDVCNVIKRYHSFESVINSMMPRSRRENNSFCRPLSRYIPNSFDALDSATDIDALAEIVFYRESTVNIQSYERHGTIEFRHHSGTMDPSKIEHWVRFCVGFVESSKEDNMFVKARSTTSSGGRTRITQKFIKLAETLKARFETGLHGSSIYSLSNASGYGGSSIKNAVKRLRDNYNWDILVTYYGSHIRVRRVGDMPEMQTPRTSPRRGRRPSQRLVKLAEFFANNPFVESRIATLAEISGYSESSIPAAVNKLRNEYGFMTNRISRRNNRITYVWCTSPGTIPGSAEDVARTAGSDAPVAAAPVRTRITNDTWERGLDRSVVAFYNERICDLAS